MIQLKIVLVTHDVLLDIVVLLQACWYFFQGIVHEGTEAVKTGISACITLGLLFSYTGLYNCLRVIYSEDHLLFLLLMTIHY